MDNIHETTMDWLRDAHAMEEQAEKMLTTTAERLENYPELRARIEQHIQETRHQAEQVRGCIQRLGADAAPSCSVMVGWGGA